MTRSSSEYNKLVKRDAGNTFFLYVFFHSIWSGIFNLLFED